MTQAFFGMREDSEEPILTSVETTQLQVCNNQVITITQKISD